MRSSDFSLPFKGQTLQIKIGAGFAALALVVFGLVGWLSGQQARNKVTEDIGASLEQVAARLMSNLDSDMFERYREIQNLAQLNGVIGSPDEPQRWRTVLEQLQQTHGHYAWIGVVDPSGTVLASTGGVLEGSSVRERPWFKQARTGVFVGDVHDAVMLGKILPPGPYGEPLRLVDVASPVYRNGQFVAVLGAHLSWAWAEERRRFILQPVEVQRQIEAVVLNRTGEVLLPTQTTSEVRLPRAAFERLLHRGPGIETWSDGRDYFSAAVQGTGYRQYAGLGWTVVVRQSLDAAMAPARHVERQIWGLGLLGAALFGLLGWRLAGRLTAPLHALAEQAETLATGDETVPPITVAQRDEVGQLTATLSELMLRLQQRSHQLTQLNQHLEERVQQRTSALEVVNEDLRSFSHSASHDLKAPIGNIALAVRHVTDCERDRIGRPSIDTLNAVANECDRLLQLIEELLLLSQVEHQNLQWAPVHMEALARAAIDRTRRLEACDGTPATSKPVDVVVGPLPTAQGDAVLLQQVWENLISNAFKFCRKADAPRIEITAETQGGEWVFSVSDNGSGFDMSQAGRLFGVFQRLHRQTDYPGTGVGLSIVKRIVHRHGGRVWAQSVPGVRTSFSFALPRQGHALPEAAAPQSDAVTAAACDAQPMAVPRGA